MSEASFLFSALWILTTIQGPWLLFCSYGVLKKHPLITSPFLAVLLVTCVGAVFFLFWNGQLGYYGSGYNHFLYYPFVFAFLDLSLYRLGYDRVDAFILSGFAVILVTQLWELPVNLFLMQNVIGPATPWQWMALPLIYLFLRKTLRLDFVSGLFLAESVALTVFAYFGYRLYAWPDYLIIPWTLFFVALFRSSIRR